MMACQEKRRRGDKTSAPLIFIIYHYQPHQTAGSQAQLYMIARLRAIFVSPGDRHAAP